MPYLAIRGVTLSCLCSGRARIRNAATGGQNWTPIRGQIWKPIDTLAFAGAPFTIVIARSAGLSECEGVNCGSANGFEPARGAFEQLGVEPVGLGARVLARRTSAWFAILALKRSATAKSDHVYKGRGQDDAGCQHQDFVKFEARNETHSPHGYPQSSTRHRGVLYGGN